MIDAREAAAIDRFASSCTIPLFYDKEQTAPLIGTATLFQVDHHYLLVTAAHLFDKPAHPERFAYPENPVKSQTFTLGRSNVWKPKNHSEIDVAVVELLDEDTIRRLSAGWTFVTLDIVAPPTAQGRFFVAGYPSVYTSQKSVWLIGRFLTVFSSRLTSLPSGAEKPVDLNLDLFFKYATEAETLDGRIVKAPELPGLSGASIWQYKDIQVDQVWTPESSVRIVGVQSAYAKGKYFRGKNWHAVASVLRSSQLGIADSLEAKLGVDA